MLLIPCPDCGKAVSPQAKACPNCGGLVAPISLQGSTVQPTTFAPAPSGPSNPVQLTPPQLFSIHSSEPPYPDVSERRPLPKRRALWSFLALLTLAGGTTIGLKTQLLKQVFPHYWASREANILREKAEKGDPGAQDAFGQCLRDGSGVKMDTQEASKWFRKSADQGFAPAWAHLGRLYQCGTGVERDEIKGLQLIRLAAEKNDPEGQRYLGYAYHEGLGIPKDDVEAVKWLRKAAEQGNAIGQASLGRMYARGLGVPKDEVEALKWFRESAKQGSAEGQCDLGDIYSDGLGVPRDDVEAVKWYRKSAEQGDSDGQNNLGIMLQKGRGVPENTFEAVKWYRRSAEQGNSSAQNNLGHMHHRGHGVPNDDAEAVKWIRRSAEQGNAFGQASLGYMYEFGYGVSKDLFEAVKWYRKAAEQGNEGAKDCLNDIEWGLDGTNILPIYTVSDLNELLNEKHSLSSLTGKKIRLRGDIHSFGYTSINLFHNPKGFLYFTFEISGFSRPEILDLKEGVDVDLVCEYTGNFKRSAHFPIDVGALTYTFIGLKVRRHVFYRGV